MNNLSLRIGLTAVCCLIFSGFVNGQTSNWVDFADERGRMMFDTDSYYIEKDIDCGDVDNDGDNDIVIARKVPFSVPGGDSNILLMNENGDLVDRTSMYISGFEDSTDDRDLRLFDANNDGWLDIVTVTTFGEAPRLYLNLCNDDNGNWQGYQNVANWFSPAFPAPGPKFCGVGIGDVNGDNFDDLLFVDYDNVLENRLLINDGDGTFTDETTTRMSSTVASVGFGTSGALVDFNYDGSVDMLVLEAALMRFIRNDGTGHFLNNSQIQNLSTSQVYMFELADFNNDGRIDIYVIDDAQDFILFNDSTNANGTVNTTKVFVSNSSLTAFFNGNLHPADVDNDGLVEMGVCDVDVDIPGCKDRRFCLLRNNGTTLTDPNNNNLQSWNVLGSHDFCWIDINCDGNLDMFLADCYTYYMFVNDEPILLGDVNRDGFVNLLDVGPFIDVLNNGTCNAQSDMNEDGVTNLLDVQGFIDAIGGN